jgi:hypothetical protein
MIAHMLCTNVVESIVAVALPSLILLINDDRGFIRFHNAGCNHEPDGICEMNRVHVSTAHARKGGVTAQ